MLLDLIAILGGFAVLVWGADRFVTGAAALADNFGVSPMLIGLTIVGFGTSAPEIIVSGMAAYNGNPGLAIGNAIGSNIANIGLILGLTALIAPLSVHSGVLKREYPVLAAVSCLALVLMLDGNLGRLDGAILLFCLVAVLYWMYRIATGSTESDPMGAEYDAEIPHEVPTSKAALSLGIGLAALLVSSRILVWGAVNVATAFGVSELIIGLTIVAIGTSLPELAASVVGALKNEHDIAIGNVIGSNLYNLLAVLSLPGLITPGSFSPEVLTRDLPVMLLLTAAIFLMGYGFGDAKRSINRFEGTALLLVFVGYQALILVTVTQAASG